MVAYYQPMVELLTLASRSVPPASASSTLQANEARTNAPQADPRQANPPLGNPPVASREVPASQARGGAQQAQRVAPREVRDIPQATRPPKRLRNVRGRDDTTVSNEQVDPRDAYAKANRDNERRGTASRPSARRYGNQDDVEPADTRSPSGRPRAEVEVPRQGRRAEVEESRHREGERGVIIREESEPRIVRRPEQRDVGFSPFRLFGISDR
jgi:hypothetical protein